MTLVPNNLRSSKEGSRDLGERESRVESFDEVTVVFVGRDVEGAGPRERRAKSISSSWSVWDGVEGPFAFFFFLDLDLGLVRVEVGLVVCWGMRLVVLVQHDV